MTRKEQLIKVANRLISESIYAVDLAYLNGFAMGANIECDYASIYHYLDIELGADFPIKLADDFMYACEGWYNV